LLYQESIIKGFHIPETKPTILLPLAQFQSAEPMNFTFLLFMAPPKFGDCGMDVVTKFLQELENAHGICQDRLGRCLY